LRNNKILPHQFAIVPKFEFRLKNKKNAGKIPHLRKAMEF